MMTVVCGALLAQSGLFGQEAQDPQLQANAANAAVQAKLSEPDGVAITIKPDGTFQIFSRGTGVYQFNHPKAKRTASQQATMRAKANLAKFLKEKVSSKEGLDSVSTNSLSMTSNGETQSQSASMDSVEVATESIRNEAEAILSGVIALKEQIVPSGKIGGEVQVTVGISSKTLEAAKRLKEGIDNNVNPGPGSGQPKPPVPPVSTPPNPPQVLINNTDF